MGTTGIIFAAIAIAWLAYLVPHFVRRSGEVPADAEADPTNRFSDSVRIVRHGTAPLLDQDLVEIDSFEVSTPLTRRAAIEDLRRLDRLAARRRRRVLIFVLLLASATVAAAALHYVSWWATAIPSGLVVVFFAVSRLSVRGMRHRLDERYAWINRAHVEATVFLSRAELDDAAAHSSPVTLSALVNKPGALWDPVPITKPTYVSKPLAPRTVRTIDLASPADDVSAGHQVPVTADTQPLPAPVKAEAGSRDDEMPEAATA